MNVQTPVTPSEAALGAKIEVPTPAGTRVEVTVPPPPPKTPWLSRQVGQTPRAGRV